MPSHQRRRDAAVARGRATTQALLKELRETRLDRDVSGRVVAAALGVSTSQYSRIERGLTRGVTIEQLTVALDAVGLDLAARAYPGAAPYRDAPQAGVIERLRARCHASIQLATEVPLPGDRDRRAWDVVLTGAGWVHRIEVETRPRDRQALERRIALKTRDDPVGGVSLVLLDSRYCRAFVRAGSEAFGQRFPVHAKVAMAALRVGADPGAGSVILL